MKKYLSLLASTLLATSVYAAGDQSANTAISSLSNGGSSVISSLSNAVSDSSISVQKIELFLDQQDQSLDQATFVLYNALSTSDFDDLNTKAAKALSTLDASANVSVNGKTAVYVVKNKQTTVSLSGNGKEIDVVTSSSKSMSKGNMGSSASPHHGQGR